MIGLGIIASVFVFTLYSLFDSGDKRVWKDVKFWMFLGAVLFVLFAALFA